MNKKPSLTPHERQMRFFTVFFGALLVAIMAGLMWLFNRR
jgi:hypothetical protein